MFEALVKKFIQDGKITFLGAFTLVLVAVIVTLGAVFTAIGPAYISNSREIDIANRETDIAGTLTVANITQSANNNLATEVAMREAEIQAISTENSSLQETIAHIPPSATQAPEIIPEIQIVIITATPSPTATSIPVPEATANRPWSDNPIIETINLPNTDIKIPIALVPRPETQYFDMEHGERGTIDKTYWIDVNEVTRLQLDECQKQDWCTKNKDDALSNNAGFSNNYPLTKIRWDEATELCNWRGGRLPSEVQWEYAARGPDGWETPNGIKNSLAIVWRGNTSLYPQAIATVPVKVDMLSSISRDIADVDDDSNLNDFSWVGASGMLGNVMEWTRTLYSASEGRYVTKGIAFSILGEQNFRFSYRTDYALRFRANDIGFRCVFEYYPENPDGLPSQ